MVRPTLAQNVIAGCYTRNIVSDHECRLGLDAQNLLDPVSNSLELVEGGDVLSPQHVPDALRQTETSQEHAHRSFISKDEHQQAGFRSGLVHWDDLLAHGHIM
jgi:hypothetical protein